jgi:hypothetical protein
MWFAHIMSTEYVAGRARCSARHEGAAAIARLYLLRIGSHVCALAAYVHAGSFVKYVFLCGSLG